MTAGDFTQLSAFAITDTILGIVGLSQAVYITVPSTALESSFI